MRLLLASASPRRKDLLASLGLDFEVIAPEIPELPRPEETPTSFTRRVAQEKARTIAATHPAAIVLAADTDVVLAGEVLGKPRDAAEALVTLRALSGRAHEVLTSVCIHSPRGEDCFTVRTGVRFAALGEAQLAWYVGTGEPLGKAGSYAIQGVGAALIEAIDGSYTNVVGLPLAEVAQALERMGVRLPWDARA